MDYGIKRRATWVRCIHGLLQYIAYRYAKRFCVNLKTSKEYLFVGEIRIICIMLTTSIAGRFRK